MLTVASLTRGSGESAPRFAALSDDLDDVLAARARRVRTGGSARVSPDQSLADLSDTFFTISVALYSVALVAFCAQLAFGRRPVRERELVGAGPAERAPEAAPDAEPAASNRWGAIGIGLTVLGALTHAAVMITRGLAVDRLPWGNMYEFGTAVVLVAVVAYSVLAVRAPALRHMGAFVLGPVVLAMVGIGLFLYAPAAPLVAALRSYWLAIHVTSAILGFGIFFVSGIASLLYLLRVRHDARAVEGETSILSRLPVGGRPRPDGPPHRRLRLPDLDVRRHRRRDLGRERLGPVLGLGPQGDLVVRGVGGLRRLPARPHDGRLARAARGLGQRGRAGRDGVQPAVREPGLDRPAQLRRRLTDHTG